MQNVKVFHQKFNDLSHKMEGYEPVANVKYEGENMFGALEYAWRWTNNVAGSWSIKVQEFPPENGQDGMPNGDFNENVEVLAPLPVYNGKTYGLRSSMVGDVFEIDGKRFVVASFGFEPYEGEVA